MYCLQRVHGNVGHHIGSLLGEGLSPKFPLAFQSGCLSKIAHCCGKNYADGMAHSEGSGGITMVIAYYPKRVPKRIESVPEKPVYSVAEVCVLLGCSRWTVIRLFENEPGVLIRLHPETLA